MDPLNSKDMPSKTQSASRTISAYQISYFMESHQMMASPKLTEF